MTKIAYLDLATFSAMTRAIALLDQAMADADDAKVTEARDVLDAALRATIWVGNRPAGAAPTDLIAILPAAGPDTPAEQREQIDTARRDFIRSLDGGNRVELLVEGRIAGVHQVKGPADEA